MSSVRVAYETCASSKKDQAGDFVCGKSAPASAAILIEERSIHYVARSKQLPRAQGATRGGLADLNYWQWEPWAWGLGIAPPGPQARHHQKSAGRGLNTPPPRWGGMVLQNSSEERLAPGSRL